MRAHTHHTDTRTHAHRAEYRSQTLSLVLLLTRSKKEIDSYSGCAKPLALSVTLSLTHTLTHTDTLLSVCERAGQGTGA